MILWTLIMRWLFWFVHRATTHPTRAGLLYNQKIKTCFTRLNKNKRCDDLAGLVHDVIQSGLKLSRGWLHRFINVIADLMAFLNEGTFVMSQASNRRESFSE